jgi:HAD superfamily hydrolase (TIGR01484 family)
LERLQKSGIIVIPITGRPAGWCDYFARMWPIQAIIGENGAFYFHYDRIKHRMIRRYWKSYTKRMADRIKLMEIEKAILNEVPKCRVSADQTYRETDLAIDFCEDVSPLPEKDILKIVDCFEKAGANAKISSIHVNGWFGDYNKLTMAQNLFSEILNVDLDQVRKQVVFVGDSPNDEPMFEYFPNATGVANVLEINNILRCSPAWITTQKGGYGFAEMVDLLLR